MLDRRYKVVEIDGMTGNERDLVDLSTNPWESLFTKESADETVEWRRKNITSRYDYRIEEVPRD